MTREEVWTYLKGANGKDIKLGLMQIKALMEKLNRPDDKLKIMHITGTNGKGSVTQFVNQILQQAGYTVGCFNSPYFEIPNECIRINDEMISDSELTQEMESIEPHIKALQKEGIEPSGFEILTALALQYFYKKEVDFVILEVGLGGCLDATNVINQSLVSVITKISVDHKDLLGETVEAIAIQKAGIIKQKGLVIATEQEQDAKYAIEEVCRIKQAHVEWMKRDSIKEIVVKEEGTTFKIGNIPYHIQMIGRHQAYNCGLAIKIVEILREKQVIEVNRAQIQKGVYKAKWEGRFEKIADKPKIFIDGAHNLDGIKSLADTMKQLKKCYSIGIMGVLRDKEVEEMLSVIYPLFDVLIATAPHHPRAMAAEVLAEKMKCYPCKVYVHQDMHKALEHALHLAVDDSEVQIIGFGSLYMIGALRHLLI